MDPATLAKVKAKIEELKAKRALMPQKSATERVKKSYGLAYSVKDTAELRAFKNEMKQQGWDSEQMSLEDFLAQQKEIL